MKNLNSEKAIFSSVGIGTTNPSSSLTVQNSGGTNSYALLVLGGNSEKNKIAGIFDTHISGTDRSAGALVLKESSSTSSVWLTAYPGANSYINNGGNVGIGIANPASKLDVDGIIEAGDTTSTLGAVGLRMKYSGVTDDYVNNFGSMYSSSASLIGYAVKSSGAEFGKFLSTADNADFSRGALVVGGDLEYLSAGAQTTTVGDEVSLTSRFKILPNGDVGIGTTSPSRKLQIHSDTAVSQTFAVTTLLGTAAISHASMGHGANKIGNLQLGNATGNLKVFLSSGGDSYFNGGNVGIGATGLNAKLGVHAVSGELSSLFHLSHGGSTCDVKFTTNKGLANQSIHFIQAHHDNLRLFVGGGATTDIAMAINAGGKVGIGTTTPQAKLETSQSDVEPLIGLRYKGGGFYRHLGQVSDITYTTTPTASFNPYVHVRLKTVWNDGSMGYFGIKGYAQYDQILDSLIGMYRMGGNDYRSKPAYMNFHSRGNYTVPPNLIVENSDNPIPVTAGVSNIYNTAADPGYLVLVVYWPRRYVGFTIEYFGSGGDYGANMGEDLQIIDHVRHTSSAPRW